MLKSFLLFRGCYASVLAFAWLVFAVSGQPSETPPGCAAPKTLLYFFCLDDTAWKAATNSLSPDSLSLDLSALLSDLGYCLVPVSSPMAPERDTGSSRSMLMHVSALRSPPDTNASVIVTLVPARFATQESIAKSRERPLVSLSEFKADPLAFRAALIKKIVENLRASYVCQLTIVSSPPGALVSTSTGLSGKAPVEWVLPMETFDLAATKDKYLPYKRKIELSRPGYHEYFISLEQRRFFHSKLTWGTAFFLASGVVCYGIDQYYYSQYRSFGQNDYATRPDAFGNTFMTAQWFERAAFASVVLAAGCFTLSFWY
jgi:hypothetical protein